MCVKVHVARRIIWDSFIEDPDFKRTYIDNTACFLMDFVDEDLTSNKTKRDELAERLINLLFTPV